MNENRATRTVVVTNREGFHLRAATMFVNLARRFDSQIEVIKDCQHADGKGTPLHLTALGAWEGDQLLLGADGSDAEAALDALAGLFAANFEERTGQQQTEQGHLPQDAAEDDIPTA